MQFVASPRYPKRAAVLAVVAALALLALAYSAPAASAGPRACPSANAIPSKTTKRALVRATLCVLNGQRARRGLRPLKLNRKLSRAARRHSQAMARKRFFSHDSLNGANFVDRIRRTGYLRGVRSWSLAENIAYGSGARGTARAIGRAWMNSPPHRANILSRSYRAIGIGIAMGTPAGRGATYTTEFGRRG